MSNLSTYNYTDTQTVFLTELVVYVHGGWYDILMHSSAELFLFQSMSQSVRTIDNVQLSTVSMAVKGAVCLVIVVDLSLNYKVLQ